MRKLAAVLLAVSSLLLVFSGCGSGRLAAGSARAKLTVSRYDGDGFSYTLEGAAAAEATDGLKALSYSKELICDCDPVYTIVTLDGGIYWIKHPDGNMEVCREAGSGGPEQAEATDGLREILKTVIAEFETNYDAVHRH